MPERTYRERLRANTLLVAKRIVANEGLPALQARRVAVDAGCSVGTIYNLYDGLDDLIINVNAATLEDLGRDLMAERDRSLGSDLSAQLTALALAYLGFALDQQPSWRAVFEHQLFQGPDRARLVSRASGGLVRHRREPSHALRLRAE